MTSVNRPKDVRMGSSDKCPTAHVKVRGNSNEITFMSRKRKGRIKPLCYTDDEDDCDTSNSGEVMNGSESLQVNTPAIKIEAESLLLSATYEDKQLNSQQFEIVVEENIKKEWHCGDYNNNANQLCLSALESQTEKPANFEEEGNPEAVCEPTGREDLGEESDSPDKSEDDRETVIFETDFNERIKDSQVFEVVGDNIRTVSRNFKKKKLVIRKKRTLVKFKRKRNMTGRNLAKVKKLRKKYSEVSNSGPQPHDNETCLREVSALVKRLHELHTIILQLQADLPKDPELADHFIKTINVQIENFQREVKKNYKIILCGCERMLSFYGNASKLSWEIEKRTSLSKKSIADVLSRCTLMERAHESKNRGKGTGEAKSDSSIPEEPPKSLETGDSSKESINDKMEVQVPGQVTPVFHETIQEQMSAAGGSVSTCGLNNNSESAPLQLSLPSNPSQPPQGPHNNVNSTKDLTPKNNSQIVQRSSEQTENTYQSFRANFSKPKNHSQAKKNNLEEVSKDFRFRQFPHDPVRNIPRGPQINQPRYFRSHSQSSNTRSPYCGGSYPAPNAGPGISSNFSFNRSRGGLLPHPEGFFSSHFSETNRPFIPSLLTINVVQPSGMYRERSVYNEYISSGFFNNFCCEPYTQNSYEPPYTKQQYTKSHRIPSKGSHVSRRRYEPSKRVDYAERRHSCPEKNLITRPEQVSRENVRPKIESSSESSKQTDIVSEPDLITEEIDEVIFISSSINPTKEKEKAAKDVLDPTVPQKLTLRNQRLEAEPIVEVKTEYFVKEELVSETRWHKPVKEEELLNDFTESEISYKNDVKPRVYECAQNGCKKPGIRICKGCMSVIYCCETCQLKHWIQKHKTECQQLKELRG